MPNNAIASKGATIRIKVGSGSWTKVNGITEFAGIRGGSPSIIDITDLDSTAREKLMGLADEGQFTFSGNYLDTDAGQTALNGARDSATIVSCEVKLPGITNVFKMDFYVMTAELGAGVDQKVSVNYTAEISGSITRGTAAV